MTQNYWWLTRSAGKVKHVPWEMQVETSFWDFWLRYVDGTNKLRAKGMLPFPNNGGDHDKSLEQSPAKRLRR